MTREMIVSNITSILLERKQDRKDINFKPCVFPITFTHKKKEAPQCVILSIQPDGTYETHKFESKFADIKDPIRDRYHAALFDCDDEPEEMDTLLDEIKQNVG